ncbi:phospholipase [Acidovorax sp. Leaf76]|uniref:SGNH/GDSL hydrolase family protein n=1 Tax=unclassified Acidovorax TaxID=2684926 RepID=UPI0006F6FA65|nr:MULTISPECIES: SGNH/GDSL hydrolase family protein [unclassified Acidovorax]KQO26963.1 phospholipase [Acidovorax sp. Leaf76]KQO40731.1 phospholipase [Acidovorax sp. Leaf84]KQS42876.1 phospholipase [Acidovorax sp. Leaf191]
MNSQQCKASLSALVAACLLAACGGGGSDTAPSAPVTSVKVAGDSLADSGTFGYKFTVQGSAATGVGSTAIWPERVATSYGQSLCAYYRFNGSAFGTNAACTNYAVGGGRINNATAPTSPVSITQQIKDMGARGYSASDLVLIDGGGNDAADLIGAYLRASTDSGQAYAALLSSVLPQATVSAALAGGANGLAQVGGAYMQALARNFADTIKANTVAKNAPRVAVLNAPGVTLTPRFRLVLASISATRGAAAATQAEALFDGWIQAFNAQLATSLAGDTRIAVVDFYTSFKDQATNPAQYQLTNTTTPACPATGVGADGLPTYTFPTCTATALSAMTPPAGATGGADWWKSYGFADSFHPTPYGHQLVGQLVSRSLSRAGWL